MRRAILTSHRIHGNVFTSLKLIDANQCGKLVTVLKFITFVNILLENGQQCLTYVQLKIIMLQVKVE